MTYQQIGADQRLERVAERDPEDRAGVDAGVDVGQQGAERDGGPHPIAAEDQAASAIPVGGQIAVTLPVVNARSSPSFAAA